MRKDSNSSIKVVLVFFSICWGNYIQAADCFENSPNFITQGDDYYNLDTTRKLSDKEKKTLEILNNKMQGKWQVTSTEFVCIGPRNNYRKENDNSEISVEISSSLNSSLRIIASKNYVKKKKKSVSFI